MKPARWTKAQVVFFTGLNGWVAMYVAVKWAALCTVAIAAYLAWLSPNEKNGVVPGATPWNPPPLQGDKGAVEPGSFALGILLTIIVIWLLKVRWA